MAVWCSQISGCVVLTDQWLCGAHRSVAVWCSQISGCVVLTDQWLCGAHRSVAVWCSQISGCVVLTGQTLLLRFVRSQEGRNENCDGFGFGSSTLKRLRRFRGSIFLFMFTSGAICWCQMPPELQFGVRRRDSSTSSEMSSVKDTKVKVKPSTPSVPESDRMPPLFDERWSRQSSITIYSEKFSAETANAVSIDAANKLKTLNIDKDKLKSLGKRPKRHKARSEMLIDIKSKLRTVTVEMPKSSFGNIRKRVFSDTSTVSDTTQPLPRVKVVKSVSTPVSIETTEERSLTPSSTSSLLGVPTHVLQRSKSFSGQGSLLRDKPYTRAMSICQERPLVLCDSRSLTCLSLSPPILRYKSECHVDYVPKPRRSEVQVSRDVVVSMTSVDRFILLLFQ